MVRKFDSGYDFRSSESLRQRDDRRQHDRSRHAALAPAVTTDGQRPCARGDWCARSTVTTDDDGKTRREPALGYQAFCPGDEAAIAAALHGMPRQYAHLLAEIGNPAREGQLIRVPFGPRIPLRLDIDSLTRFTREILSCWEETGRERPRPGSPGHGGLTEAARAGRRPRLGEDAGPEPVRPARPPA